MERTMSGIWPGDTRCVAVLSFDMDGASAMIHRNPDVQRMPSTLSHGDFGPRVAVPRILELLREHDIAASFYVPGWVAERFPDTVAAVASAGHEVAPHGYMHEPPATLSRDEEAAILDRSSAILEGITGERPLGYRSPSWELSEHSLDLLMERGFVYDSSLMGDDAPYRVPAAGGGELVEIPVHWSLDDAPYFVFNPAVSRTNVPASPAQVYDTWSTAFDELYDRGRCYVLTVHPWIIGRAGRLTILDRLIRHIREQPGVKFRRSIGLARDVQPDCAAPDKLTQT
jgi:peptidoglycan/xylan/chitin deacetylase (PgdA/CDA1 family)